MKKLFYLLLPLIVLSLSACKSRTQKMHEFANAFNQTAAMSPMQSGTHAEVEGLDMIKLDLATTMDINDPSSATTSSFLEKSLPSMFQSDETMMDLINEAVKFKVNLIDVNGRIVTSLVVDKAYLDKQNKGSYKSSTTSDPITQALEALNSSLPVKNADGTRLMKIEKVGTSTIEYTLEIPEELNEIINSPNATPLVKESITQDPNTRNTIRKMRSFGITNVNYLLVDTKGKKLTTLAFKTTEF